MSNYRYLLDTNIVSELIINPKVVAADRILSSGLEAYCCTNITSRKKIVIDKLRNHGAATKEVMPSVIPC